MENPISLKHDYAEPLNAPEISFDMGYPRVWLDKIKGVVIPEEGEIRFRYSRKRLTVDVTDSGTSQSVELCLKSITDICDCEREDGTMKDEDGKDSDAAIEKLMKSLSEDDLEDESEDDNPDKY